MIKAILFDYDGVIMDTLDVAHLVWKQISEEFDAKIKIKNIEHYKELFTCNVIEMLKNIGLSKKELGRAKELWISYQKKYPPKPFKGIKEVLEKLSQKYILAIVSGSLKEVIEDKLKKYELTDFFKLIIPIIEVSKNKPNPYHINIAIKKLNVNPEEIIYIGDTVEDVQAAREAGIKKIINVSYGFGIIDSLQSQNPTKIVHSPTEILEAIEELK